MYPVEHAAVDQWGTTKNTKWATVISLNCSHCSASVTIAFSNRVHDDKRDTYALSGRCPRCKGVVHSWTLNSQACAKGSDECYVFVYPVTRRRLDLIDGHDRIPENIATQYKRTVDSYNNGSWLEVGVRSRRTLEALVNHLVPEPDRSKALAQNLEKLPKHTDLTKPTTDLSNALREGGNFSAHFAGEAEPNEETAEAMVELVEFMLEYLFVVPGRTADLADHIEELQKSEQAT